MLRDVLESDLPILFEQQRDPEACRVALFPPRDREAFMLHWRTKVLPDPGCCKKAIISDGKVAGNIGSWSQEGERLVGYWLGTEYWGRGIATAALAEFLLEEQTRPLCAYVAQQNLGSIRVLEKCGFRRVGPGHVGTDVEEYIFQLDT